MLAILNITCRLSHDDKNMPDMITSYGMKTFGKINTDKQIAFFNQSYEELRMIGTSYNGREKCQLVVCKYLILRYWIFCL